MQVCVKLWRLEKRLVGMCLDKANENGMTLMSTASQIKDITRVCSWALLLADDRMPDEDRQVGLSVAARCFQDVFGDGASPMDGKRQLPSLSFNPNDHKVDPSLWGKTGAKASSYASLT